MFGQYQPQANHNSILGVNCNCFNYIVSFSCSVHCFVAVTTCSASTNCNVSVSCSVTRMCCSMRKCGKCCCTCHDDNTVLVEDNCCECNYAAMRKLGRFKNIDLIYVTYHVDVSTRHKVIFECVIDRSDTSRPLLVDVGTRHALHVVT